MAPPARMFWPAGVVLNAALLVFITRISGNLQPTRRTPGRRGSVAEAGNIVRMGPLARAQRTSWARRWPPWW